MIQVRQSEKKETQAELNRHSKQSEHLPVCGGLHSIVIHCFIGKLPHRIN